MIYVASKTRHATMWKQLRAAGMPIISTWIDEAEQGQTEDHKVLWDRIRDEIGACDGMIFYCEPEDMGSLKGAFVEVGMALMLNVPIVVWAPRVHIDEQTFRPIGSWMKSRQVIGIFGNFDVVGIFGVFETRPAHKPGIIVLKPFELQSGLDRVRHAQGLIEQLPEDHEGRNSWLMNYGRPK